MSITGRAARFCFGTSTSLYRRHLLVSLFASVFWWKQLSSGTERNQAPVRIGRGCGWCPATRCCGLLARARWGRVGWSAARVARSRHACTGGVGGRVRPIGIGWGSCGCATRRRELAWGVLWWGGRSAAGITRTRHARSRRSQRDRCRRDDSRCGSVRVGCGAAGVSCPCGAWGVTVFECRYE
jgi:hypothetical protein